MRERPNTQSTNQPTNLHHTTPNHTTSQHHTTQNLHHITLNHITNQHHITQSLHHTMKNHHTIRKTSPSLFSSHFHLTLSHTIHKFL